jgi:glucokinase
MILAGDIGGTKALLLAALRQGRPEPVLERRYAVASFPGFSAMLARFLEKCHELRGRDARLASACFGAAGPVSDARIQMTNLPWCLDVRAIAAEFGIGRVLLVNDFESAALRASVRADGAAAISRHALEHDDPLACRALGLFIACYGAVAGDHALAIAARGGVYIAGGIAPKILSRLAAGGFTAALNAKGANAQMNLRMPVQVVTTERLGLLGAALVAARRR